MKSQREVGQEDEANDDEESGAKVVDEEEGEDELGDETEDEQEGQAAVKL